MKKHIIEFSIEPTKTVDPQYVQVSELDDTQREYQSWLETQSPLDQEGPFEQLVFDSHADLEMTPSPSSHANHLISGNLLGQGVTDNTLLQIEGHPISDLTDSEGQVLFHHEDGAGTLTLFTQTTQDHQAGDFLYTLHENPQVNAESFEYTIQNEHGINATFTLSFEISEKGIQVGDPELSTVAEEGLLPGHHELLKSFGNLNVDTSDLDNAQLTFAPLVEQRSLIGAHLSSNGEALYYSMNDDATVLYAHQGAHGPKVFQATLHDDGSYSFELSAPLDHEPPVNLIADPNFDQFAQGYLPLVNADQGWRSHESHLVSLAQSDSHHESIVSQSIPVEPGAPYLLQMSVANLPEDGSALDLIWNDKRVHSFEGNQPTSFYSIALEGGAQPYSELKLVATDSSQSISECIQHIQLSSMAIQKLPLAFAFQVLEAGQILLANEFTVQVNIEPSIMVHDQPQVIVYDQTVYQSIVVSEQNQLDSPLATLNLEALFEQLNMDETERLVEVVQLLEEDGHSTHTYEVQIIDKNQPLAPIAVADVQLTFAGGDGGLDVFYKHIQILDS